MAIRFLDEEPKKKAIRFLDEEPQQEKPGFLRRAAATAAGLFQQPPTPGPGERGPSSMFGRLREAFVPTEGGVGEQVRRLANPVAGRFGLSRFLQQEGQAVRRDIDQASENIGQRIGGTPGAVVGTGLKVGTGMVPITPEETQQMIGADLLGAGVGKAVKTTGKPILKSVSKAGSVFSGVKPQSYARLVDDPSAILPASLGGPAPRSVAGKAIGEGLEKAGIKAGAIDPMGSPGTMVNELFSKATQGADDLSEKAIPSLVKKLTPEEQHLMLRNLNEVMSGAVPGKNAPLIRTRTLWKNALKESLDKAIPGYSEAIKDFARAALRGEFSSFFPRSKYGGSSAGRLLFGGGPLYAAGHAIGGPVAGALTGAFGVSPAVHGLATATAAGALKASPVGGVLGFRAIVARARELQRKSEKRGKKK